MPLRPSALAALVLTLAFTALPAAAGPSLHATFKYQGPAPIAEFPQGTPDFYTSGNGPFAGAVKQVVMHPTNRDTLWIGTVNGGVWRTDDATSSSPHWRPLTDHQPSLSIGALALDFFSEPWNTLVAGIGHRSSFNGAGGPLTGILLTTDGGDHWTAIDEGLGGEDITAVVVRPLEIVVGAKGKGGGLFRKGFSDSGFTKISGKEGSGLPDGNVYDLIGDFGDSELMFAGVVGPNGGVYRSTDGGANWHARGGVTFGGASMIIRQHGEAVHADIMSGADNVKLAIHNLGGDFVLYAVVDGINPAIAGDTGGELTGLFSSRDQGGSWKAHDLPINGTDGLGLHPGTQGGTHLSIAADPLNDHLIYLAGDRDQTGSESGRIFRCDLSAPSGSPPGTQYDIETKEDTASMSAPHPDSRSMAFDANGNLVETDDGGIYRRTSPDVPGGDWSSINGDLGATEAHSIAYDHVAHVALIGLQDNGSAMQRGRNRLVWDSITPYDGALVGSVPGLASGGTGSTRYFGTHNLDQFSRATFDSGNNLIGFVNPTLTVIGSGGQALTQVEALPIYPPMAVNPHHPHRLILANQGLYESLDGGHTLQPLSGFGGTANRAIAYGADGHPDVIYAGSSNGLFVRKAAGNSVTKAHYPSSTTPVALALDRSHEDSVWVVGADGSVRHSNDWGQSWVDHTGDLGAAGLRSIELMRRSGTLWILVGADDGLYASDTHELGTWHKLRGALPDAVVADLVYDSADDVLMIATLGRSVWSMPSASELDVPPIVDAGAATASIKEGAAFVRHGSFDDPDGAAHESYTATVSYGDGSGTHVLALTADHHFTLDHTYADNGNYPITVLVSDAHGGTGSATVDVKVENVAPKVSGLNVTGVVALGDVTHATADFTDPGKDDTHTAVIDWGDGTGDQPATVSGHHVAGSVAGHHRYSLQGVFGVTLTVTDKDGGQGSATTTTRVYDPNARVQGKGTYAVAISGSDAHPATAGFTLQADYPAGSSTPEGLFSLQIAQLGIDVESTLVRTFYVTQIGAQVTGDARVNRRGGYHFSAVVRQGLAGAFPDAIRFQITTTLGRVVYDTQPGAGGGAPPSTALTSGSIRVQP